MRSERESFVLVNSRRQHAKRDRKLGYNQPNSSFFESHGHHIDKTNVVYIPGFLDMSVTHNVFNGKGMKEINALAFQWIATQENFEGLDLSLKNRRKIWIK